MSRWFRFYAKAMRTPKVMRLSDRDFRIWVNMLAIASENDGRLPSDDDLKRLLGMRLDHLKGVLKRLIRGGLIDPLVDGYEPHDWGEHQYKSDTSTERVKRYREKRNVSETAPDTDTDSVADATDGKPSSAIDLQKAVFDSGVPLLVGAGTPERSARAMLGKWRRTYGDGAVLDSLAAATAESVSDPIPWLTRALEARNGKRTDKRDPIFAAGDKLDELQGQGGAFPPH